MLLFTAADQFDQPQTLSAGPASSRVAVWTYGVSSMTVGLKNAVGLKALILAGGLMMAANGARAADLGGNCCADLEERVAELEATTVRKGNRKVSVQVYGQISEAILFWNDGSESNVYVQENNLVKNRIGFQGSARINSDWSAGFRLEYQARAYRSSSANQLALGASNNTNIPAYNIQSIALREANWFLRSNTFGTITVGRTTDAASGLGTINLVNPDGFASNGYGGAFAHQGYFLRRSGVNGNQGLSALNWNHAFNRTLSDPVMYDYSGNAAVVKYASPLLLGQSKSTGFQGLVSFGQDDVWAVGLRYVETIGAIRIAAGASYSHWSGIDQPMCANLGLADASSVDCTAIQASGSILHVPTGLYVSGGWGQIEDSNRRALANRLAANLGSQISDTDSSWWVQAGWQAKLNALGSTIFWGQYAEFKSAFGMANNAQVNLGANDAINSFAGVGTINIKSSSGTSWGLGVSQNIDAAAMTLYAGYINSSVDLTLVNRANLQNRKSNAIDDFGVFFTGATIRF